MATWPSTLPAPQASGYSFDPVDACIRTNMEFGQPRVRARSLAQHLQVMATWVFTDAQLQAFVTWFKDSSTGAAFGSAYFDIRLPLGAGGLTTVQARFVGAYKVSHIEKLNWRVSATLEIR